MFGFKVGPLGFEIGWFSGDEWRLLSLDFAHVVCGDLLMLFSLFIGKFSISISIDL